MSKEISKEVSEIAISEMCNDEFKLDFVNNIKSRYPLFYITTNEERRLIQFLDHFRRAKGYDCFLWNCYDGLVDIKNKTEVVSTTEDLKSNPIAVLDYIIEKGSNYSKKQSKTNDKKGEAVNGILYVLLDYFRFIDENPDIERRFKAIADQNSIVCTICTGPYYKSTDVIENLMPILDFPLPNKKEYRHALYEVSAGAVKKIPDISKKTKEMEEDLINSVSGLTIHEAQCAFSKSLVAHHDWDLHTILDEKKQSISKSGMLDYYDKAVSMLDIGGLKNLVNWIKDRKKCFSQEAEDYGLKKPRGLLAIGMPGCVCEETKIKIKKISDKGNCKIYEK